jgi:hypothetical protein
MKSGPLNCKTCNKQIIRSERARGARPKFCDDLCRRTHPDNIAKKKLERVNYKETQNERRAARREDPDYRRAELDDCARRYQEKTSTPEGAAEMAIHQRTGKLKRNYGMTIEQYDAMLAAQGGRCGCCDGTKSSFLGGNKLAVDHDHSTKCVRGLLCNTCNSGIGKLGDTLAGVKNAVRYLERYERITNQSWEAGIGAGLL